MPAVGGTGICVGTWSDTPAARARAERIQKAMSDACADCIARGVTDEKELIAAINAAREQAEAAG